MKDRLKKGMAKVLAAEAKISRLLVHSMGQAKKNNLETTFATTQLHRAKHKPENHLRYYITVFDEVIMFEDLLCKNVDPHFQFYNMQHKSFQSVSYHQHFGQSLPHDFNHVRRRRSREQMAKVFSTNRDCSL